MEKIRLKLKAYDHRVLDRSVAAIFEAVKKAGINLSNYIKLNSEYKKQSNNFGFP